MTAAGGGLRAVVVGARRARQGTGAFLARAFDAAGCEVVGVVGTTEASAALAAEGLRSRYGILARPFASTPSALDATRPDILVIATPWAAHARDLERALAARVHVLCEKPLVWSESAPDDPDRLARQVRALAEGFREAGCVLGVHAQWPEALPAFRELHPCAGAERPPRAFAMRMSPTDTGELMAVESLPHPLSLLDALAGPGTVEAVEARWGAEQAALALSFAYRHASGSVACHLDLVRVPEQPRPVWIEVDGQRAERALDLTTYAAQFVDAGRCVPLPDPLDLRVAGFLADIQRGRPADPERLAAQSRGLAELIAATRRAARAPAIGDAPPGSPAGFG